MNVTSQIVEGVKIGVFPEDFGDRMTKALEDKDQVISLLLEGKRDQLVQEGRILA